MVLGTVFRCKPTAKSVNPIHVSTQTNEDSNPLVQSAPMSIPSRPVSHPVKKPPQLTTSNSLLSLLSSSPIVDGLEFHNKPENKCVESPVTPRTKTRRTRYTSQGPWTSQPMPKMSEEIKRTVMPPAKKRNFLMKQLLKLRRLFSKPPQPLQLDGPYINPVLGCSCGKCEQEFYVNKYVGYGVNVYSNKTCTIIPAHCNDFAVVFYC